MNEDQIIGRVAVIEYVVTQAFILALKNTADPQGVLTDAAEHFANSMSKTNMSPEQKHFAQDASERIFTTARKSIGGESGESH